MGRSKLDEALLENTRGWVETVQSEKAYNGWEGENPIARRIDTLDVHGEGFEAFDDDSEHPVPIRGKARVELIQEITVEEDMCNAMGNMHGGCGAYLLDVCTSHAINAFSDEPGWQSTGVSTDMHIRFLNPALPGMRLRLISDVISVGGRLAMVDFRAVDTESGKTILVGSHAKASLPTKSKL